MEWTPEKIFLAILGSGGFITAVVMAFNALAARLDARRTRKQQAEDDAEKKRRDEIELKIRFDQLIHNTEGGSQKTVADALWEIINEKNKELEEYKRGNLTRPLIKQLYSKLRQMRVEAEKCRTCNIKALIDEMESLLP
jgi:anaerobic ribonucleoside-triphosphate reductase